MSFLGAYRTYLLAQTGITDLTGTRIYNIKAPQGTEQPYIVFNVVSDPNVPISFTEQNAYQQRIQTSIFAKKAVDCETIRVALKAAIISSSFAITGYTTHNKLVLNHQYLYEDNSELYHVPVDVYIEYEEA